MKKFITHTGVAAPLPRTNIDTDQILPAAYLKRVTRTGFEDALFESWRKDPTFVLNRPGYENATILVAGKDFGTGSSREHAVWALNDYGFRAVLSSRFADIFRGNAGKNGLLAAQVEDGDLELILKLLEANPGIEMTVDLVSRTVSLGGHDFGFQVDDNTRWRLMEGLDDIGITLANEDAIKAYEDARPSFKPSVRVSDWVTPQPRSKNLLDR